MTKADIKASNGVVHFIDGVMMVPKGDLVAVLADDDRYNTSLVDDLTNSF